MGSCCLFALLRKTLSAVSIHMVWKNGLGWSLNEMFEDNNRCAVMIAFSVTCNFEGNKL